MELSDGVGGLFRRVHVSAGCFNLVCGKRNWRNEAKRHSAVTQHECTTHQLNASTYSHTAHSYIHSRLTSQLAALPSVATVCSFFASFTYSPLQ